MSLKKRAKVQHSPNSQISKQISNDMSMNSTKQNKKNQQINQFKLLQKMQLKVHKIMAAYQKLQNESTKKDEYIKQIENQNQLFKKRIFQLSQLRNEDKVSKKKRYQKHDINEKNHYTVNECKKDDIKTEKEGYVIQRIFTPHNIIRGETLPQEEIQREIIPHNIIQRTFTPDYDSKVQFEKFNDRNFSSLGYNYIANNPSKQYKQINLLDRKLKQSRSLQNLSLAMPYRPNQSTLNNMDPSSIRFRNENSKPLKFSPNQNFSSIKLNHLQDKGLLKRQSNCLILSGIEQDQGFLEVLGKLKEKIKKFDQDDVQNLNTTPYPIEIQLNDFKLSKVKSTDNLTIRPSHLTQSIVKQDHKKQINALKNIWNQRDQQIRKMDLLFKTIDQRLNISNNK